MSCRYVDDIASSRRGSTMYTNCHPFVTVNSGDTVKDHPEHIM